MSEEKKNVSAEADKKVNLTDPQEQLKLFGKGKMELAAPIRADGKDVNTLKYDFTVLTGMEFVEALDKDTGNSTLNAFKLTNKQALNLFAAAAAKVTDGIDATDIRERIGAIDSVKAVQLATIFFSASNRAGNNRISNE